MTKRKKGAIHGPDTPKQSGWRKPEVPKVKKTEKVVKK